MFQIPNGLGVLLGTAQLILYATYYKSTMRMLAEKKGKGEVGMTQTAAAPSRNGRV